MGRRELRAELQATWSVYQPRVPGTPFTKKDLEDADEAHRRRSSAGESSHPAAQSPPRGELEDALDAAEQRAADLTASLPRALLGRAVK